MNQIYVCGKCERRLSRADAEAGPFCPFCLTRDIRLEDEPEPKPRRGSSARVTSLADVEDPVTIPCKAPLVACLGGIQRGALIVVSGEPGEGKSTECARVAVALGEPPAYLDREMAEKRCHVVLTDAGASARFIRQTRRIVSDRNNWILRDDWRDAIDLALGRSIWILDSVSAWVRAEQEPELAAALVDATEAGVIVFAIQQWSRQGRAKGSLEVEHRGDVTIDLVTHEGRPSYHVRKARWGEKGFYPRPPFKRT